MAACDSKPAVFPASPALVMHVQCVPAGNIRCCGAFLMAELPTVSTVTLPDGRETVFPKHDLDVRGKKAKKEINLKKKKNLVLI